MTTVVNTAPAANFQSHPVVRKLTNKLRDELREAGFRVSIRQHESGGLLVSPASGVTAKAPPKKKRRLPDADGQLLLPFYG